MTFADPSAVKTTASFSVPGTYALRLTANDSALEKFDEASVDVKPGTPTNSAPKVSAGPDISITLPAKAALNGSAGDDGLPDPPAKLSLGWSNVSGPGAVSFADPASAATSASFSAAGSYVLRLTADDGALQSSDDAAVDVKPAPPGQDAKPTVAILSPADGATVSKTVTVAVQAGDDRGVASVRILVDGAELKSMASPPYTATWDTTRVADGKHTIKGVATDSAGQAAEASASVVVENAAPPPPSWTGWFGSNGVWIVVAAAVAISVVATALAFSRRARRTRAQAPPPAGGR